MYIIILTIVTKLGIAQSHLWLCGIVFVTAEHWYVACKIGFIDFSPHGQFAPWTFCPTLDISPHGRSPMGDSPIDDSPHERGAKRPEKNVAPDNISLSVLADQKWLPVCRLL